MSQKPSPCEIVLQWKWLSACREIIEDKKFLKWIIVEYVL